MPDKPLQPNSSACSTPAGTACIAVVAGEGHLPVEVAKTAQAQGYGVIGFSLFGDNVAALKPYCLSVERMTVGLIDKNLARAKALGVTALVFAGKVNKWLLLQDPRMDARALNWLSQLATKNDDSVMISIIEALEAEGLKTWPQTRFLGHLFAKTGVLAGLHPPSVAQLHDINLGFALAKEMGRLDVGQSVVMKDGMILAIEAIEGTDECLKRAGKLAKGKGGVVVKVAKPNQDERFDVPTVGLRTLKVMKAAGLKVLAVEAGQTLMLDEAAMALYAQKHGLCVLGLETNQSINPEAPSEPSDSSDSSFRFESLALQGGQPHVLLV